MDNTTLTFDLVKSSERPNSRIDYGFIFGRDRQKIFLIKTGQDGTINGYQNKYLKLAYELRDKYGFSGDLCLQEQQSVHIAFEPEYGLVQKHFETVYISGFCC